MRKLFLLAITAVAAMAFAAAPANADPVEIEDRAEGVMCDNTTAGSCEIHIINDDADLVTHTIFGEFSFNCDVEILADVASDGSASSTEVEINDGVSTNCDESLEPCEEPWTGQGSHNGAGEESLTTQICIDPPFISPCEGGLHAHLDKDGDNYSAELTDVEIEGDPNCEFTGDYDLEDPDGVEIHHV